MSVGVAVRAWPDLLLGAIVLALPVALVPDDWAGWWLAFTCVGIVLASPTLARDRGVQVAALTVLLAHEGAALAAAYGLPVERIAPDAAYFHDYASDIAAFDPLRLRLGSGFYENLLAAAYRFLGASRMFGEQISVACFTLATLVFVRLLDRLEVRRWRSLWVLVFGLPLPVILFTSLTMREGLQLLCFVASVEFALQARGGRPLAALPALVCAFVLGLTHAVLLAFVAATVLVFLAWPAPGGRGRRRVAGAVAVVVLLAGAAALIVPRLDVRLADNPFVMLNKGVLAAIGKYRDEVNQGRPDTLYRAAIDTSSPGAALSSFPSFYAHYLFAPFPWQVRNAKDLYASAEGALRLALAVLAVAGLWFAARGARYPASLLLFLFVAMTLMWSIGTTNYGQGLRHHVLTHWLLVALGAFGFERLRARRTRP